METIQEEYCTKHKKSITDLNDNDKKLIQAIYNLRQNYKKSLHERKAVHFLRNIHNVNILNYDPNSTPATPATPATPTTPTTPTTPATSATPATPTTPATHATSSKCICKAFKKCGSPCTSPAKFGDFCGRHNSKK